MKKIAVPVTSDDQIDEHFGHCEFYNVYTISDNNEIVEIQRIKSEQVCGCKSNIAVTLAQSGVSVMLAGGIGSGAINVLNSAGIEVVRGCSGNSSVIVKQFVEGLVRDDGSVCQKHEHHHNGGHHHICNN